MKLVNELRGIAQTMERLGDLAKAKVLNDAIEALTFACGGRMKIKLDPGAYLPTRAHSTNAGLDLYARDGQIVCAKDSAVFDTGVHIELPPNTVGFLKSKSGLNVNHGIVSEGVIDVGYTGSIRVKLYNHNGYDYTVRPGDKISQLVILPILTPKLMVVDELAESDRGDSGFGSSGR